MKVLITGAGGRIGGRLVAALADRHQLVLLDRRLAAPPPAAKGYQIDLDDFEALERLIASEKPEAVIHLAALVGPVCESDPALAKKVNVDATKTLAELAAKAGAKKFIFASTAAVYHQTELAPTDEEHNVDPRSVYGETKLEAERELLAALQESGTRAIILRLFNIYGPEFDSSLINRLVSSTPGNPVELRGPDNYYRDYIHVDDAVGLLADLLDAAENPADQVFNIANGRAVSNAKLIGLLEDKGFEPDYKLVPGDTDISWADISRAKAQLGFSPREELVF